MMKTMRIILILIAILIASPAIKSCWAAPAEFYIAPSGSDSNPGTFNFPFASIERAKTAIKDLKDSGSFSGAIVYLRGGVYQRSDAIRFQYEADSGAEGKLIILRNYPGEKPVLRGSRVVSSAWESTDKPNILQADLSSWPDAGSLIIHGLYFNGQRQMLARTPNPVVPDFTKDDPYAGTWYFASLENPCTAKRDLIYNAADLSTAMVESINLSLTSSPANPAQVSIYSQYDWNNNILNVASLNTASRTITLANDVNYHICPKNRYHIQNVFAALDAPGEWYYDRANRKLFFYPPRPLSPGDRISVGVVPNALFIMLAHHLVIQGLTFEEFGRSTAFPFPKLSSPLYIGQRGDAAQYFNGYLDEVRISKGIARHTANFTPATAAYTADSYTKLLLHMNGADGSTSFIDSSASAHPLTASGNAKISTDTSAFGASVDISSGLFDGNADFLTSPNHTDYDLGSGNFTIDFWAYLNALPASSYQSFVLFGQFADSRNLWSIRIINIGGVYYLGVLSNTAGANELNYSVRIDPTLRKWHHFELARSGNTFYLFQNGVLLGAYSGASSRPIWVASGNHITISNNIVKDSVGYGIFVNGNAYDINIMHNQVFNLSQDGIYVATSLDNAKTLTPSNIIISDNLVHHIGSDYAGSGGIMHSYTVGGVVSHNEIYDLPRSAIDNTANDAIIEYNKLYNLNLLSQDTAAIYDRGNWLRRGTIMRNNYIKDTHGYGKFHHYNADGPMRMNFGTVGVYFDDTASGGQAYNNIVINAPTDCLNNNGGRDNSYTNNICINCGSDGGTGQVGIYSFGATSAYWDAVNNMERDGYIVEKYYHKDGIYDEQDHYPELERMMDDIRADPSTMDPGKFLVRDQVERNIFYFPAVSNPKGYHAHNINTDQQFDKNLFFPGSKALTVFRSYPGETNIYSWEGWKSLGFDTHSLITDPLFEDPLIGTPGHYDNFNLKPASLALALGFTPIDLKSVGIRPFGDVSGDGEISAYDAALVLRAVAGLVTLTPDQVIRADVSDDGKLSAYDAALIALKVVGLIPKFPIEG